jgi:hypothetical protein
MRQTEKHIRGFLVGFGTGTVRYLDETTSELKEIPLISPMLELKLRAVPSGHLFEATFQGDELAKNGDSVQVYDVIYNPNNRRRGGQYD